MGIGRDTLIRSGHLTIIFILGLTVSNCRRATEQNNIDEPADEIQLGFGTEEQMEEIFYRFPSPDEMLSVFEGEEFEYFPHLLLPTEKSKQYLDSKSQALNLGVYLGDLAYLTLFSQTQEAHKYMLSIYSLSEKLRISSAFDFDVLKRFEENIRHTDSLKALSYEALNGLNTYLEKNKKENTFILISIGGYIESLYLSFSLVGDFSEDNPLIQRISDQKFVLNNIISFALRYADDNNVSEAIELLEPIRKQFSEIVVSKTPTRVEKDSTGKITISGGNKYEITEEQYIDLKQTVSNLRSSITQYQ